MATGTITLTLTFADSTKITEFRDNCCLQLGFTGTAPDGTVETKQQFLNRMVTAFLRDASRAGRKKSVLAAAASGADATEDAIVIT